MCFEALFLLLQLNSYSKIWSTPSFVRPVSSQDSTQQQTDFFLNISYWVKFCNLHVGCLKSRATVGLLSEERLTWHLNLLCKPTLRRVLVSFGTNVREKILATRDISFRLCFVCVVSLAVANAVCQNTGEFKVVMGQSTSFKTSEWVCQHE